MKKVLVVLAAIALTCSVQAVSLNWSLSSGTDLGAANSGNLVLLVRGTALGSAPSINVASGILSLGSGFDLLGVGNLTASGGFTQISLVASGNWSATATIAVQGLGLLPAGNTFPSTVSATAAGAAGKMDYYMVVFNGDTLSLSTQAAIMEKENISPTLASSNFAVQFNPTTLGTFVNIPEPTSLALLALGAAAVGLRRKFRK